MRTTLFITPSRAHTSLFLWLVSFFASSWCVLSFIHFRDAFAWISRCICLNFEQEDRKMMINFFCYSFLLIFFRREIFLSSLIILSSSFSIHLIFAITIIHSLHHCICSHDYDLHPDIKTAQRRVRINFPTAFVTCSLSSITFRGCFSFILLALINLLISGDRTPSSMGMRALLKVLGPNEWMETLQVLPPFLSRKNLRNLVLWWTYSSPYHGDGRIHHHIMVIIDIRKENRIITSRDEKNSIYIIISCCPCYTVIITSFLWSNVTLVWLLVRVFETSPLFLPLSCIVSSRRQIRNMIVDFIVIHHIHRHYLTDIISDIIICVTDMSRTATLTQETHVIPRKVRPQTTDNKNSWQKRWWPVMLKKTTMCLKKRMKRVNDLEVDWNKNLFPFLSILLFDEQVGLKEEPEAETRSWWGTERRRSGVELKNKQVMSRLTWVWNKRTGNKYWMSDSDDYS